LAATVLSFGTDSLLIRLVVGQPEESLNHLGRVLTTRVLNLTAGFILLNLAVWFLHPQWVPVLLLVAAYDFLEEIFYCFSAFFAAQKQMVYRLLLLGGFKILLFFGVAGAALATGALFPVLWAYLLIDLALVLTTAWFVRKQYGVYRLQFDLQSSLSLLRTSAPFFVLNFLTILHMRLDIILVGILTNVRQVANYELAIKLMEVSRFLVRPVNTIFFPLFSQYVFQNQWPRLRTRFVQLTVLALGAGILLAIGMQLFGPRLIVFLFGPGYLDSVPAVRILFLSVPLMYVNFICSTLATAMQREKATAWILGCVVVLNAVVNLAVIPRFGIAGAAWTTVLTQAILLISMLILTLPVLIRPPHTDPEAAPVLQEDLRPPELF
jgi:O-antigen/teichoic acid export membrane protein